MPGRREIRLFPLETVALFPKVRAPLHIFEPRYRQMMEAALAGDRTLGMATVLPEHQHDMAGAPPLFEIGCAGFIETWERLADGRYNLLLHGVERFRIQGERPSEAGRLYRVADIEPLAEAPLGADDVAAIGALREQVAALIAELVRRSGNAGEFAPERFASLDHEVFANGLCQMLGLPVQEKLGLLLADGARSRIETLEGVLQFHLARLRQPGGRSDTVH